ncbi:MAG: SDR family oxidoreductase [Chloroflexota bacterium]|nr:SDR family oxidoreductase [Chloroflexota bacterium]
MYVSLKDQVALVTGSAHRVGRAIALELARNGVHIIVHYNRSNEETVKATLRDIKSLGVEAYPIQADISTPAGVEATFAAVETHFGRLNILVNSASNFQKRTLMEVTLDEWNETMAINVTAPFLCTQAAVPLMRRNTPSGGCIVNICDRGATDVWVDYAHHGVSKAGLWALTRVSAASLGPDIRANAIIPGAVLKPADYDEESWRAGTKDIPMQRPGTAEDVGRAVVYLASEDWLSGTLIHVDGGESIV